MELRALRYFVTVAEELHFGRAAQRLHIVQPAVSQQIARLERELGVTLLDRSRRHVRLTSAGERILAEARSTLAAAERLRLLARGLGTEPTSLRIGTAPGLTGRLEHGVRNLRAANPGVEVILVDQSVAEHLSAVRSGELDIALVRGIGDATGLRVRPAWSEQLHVVLPSCHPLGSRPALRVAELAAIPLRFPQRELDPPLHDLVRSTVCATGVRPTLGRPAGATAETIVEIGGGAPSWTLMPAELLASAGSKQVVGVPLDPPLTVTGSVIAAETISDTCLDAFAGAFSAGN